ncbi:BZ3500_MvSof-1268-A1-R1_Chr1-2g01348 [Microbotryum saponariae]|uniref:BZ3500_MvSof-1268-A1-R1_Chr1-2g01348 protein n=1 Tax=Microbotryum saponariae TaxID=289078 RepID=A0A2X0MH04_9BASI|nr:BZ3500_MvSof-1268-A1-R1_Chr1-2g01348 [Microbotryum saponariae]SCZ97168.1 BZ3501_MvSof-1269-A2-R1_Chr1-2g00947 [Microbotryum saponariae]
MTVIDGSSVRSRTGAILAPAAMLTPMEEVQIQLMAPDSPAVMSSAEPVPQHQPFAVSESPEQTADDGPLTAKPPITPEVDHITEERRRSRSLPLPRRTDLTRPRTPPPSGSTKDASPSVPAAAMTTPPPGPRPVPTKSTSQLSSIKEHRHGLLGKFKSLVKKSRRLDTVDVVAQGPLSVRDREANRRSSVPVQTSHFPHPSSAKSNHEHVQKIETNESGPDVLTRRSLKVRIVTFNMHDSLPSSNGDLKDFLGVDAASPRVRPPSFGSHRLPGSSPGAILDKRMSKSSSRVIVSPAAGSMMEVPAAEHIPVLKLTPEQPYHVIVVCGQECPTAARVRAPEAKRWTSVLEEWLCGRPALGNGDDKESHPHTYASSHPHSNSVSLSHDDAVSPPLHPDEPKIRSAPAASTATNEEHAAEAHEHVSPTHMMQKFKMGRGPYVLVEKERLLGIYCAVFVARSCDELVKGTSRGRVTAGLMGGRLGNKGGVGVSLWLGSSKLLFISAHLAAHASGNMLRKANAQKILDELVIDDFAGGGAKAGDLMTRFDQVFFMGDLNFRLNVSRLHADWIVRSKDYVTALQFDQLRDVLAEENGVFKGFKEGDITFAPTYKYDVPKIRRRGSLAVLRSPKANNNVPPRKPREWTALELADEDTGAISDPEVLQATREKNDITGGGDELRSLRSSKGSVNSAMSNDEKHDREELSAVGLPSAPSKGNDTAMEHMRKSQIKLLARGRSESAGPVMVTERKGSALLEAFNASPPKSKRKLTIGALTGAPFAARPILRSVQSDLTIPLSRSPGQTGTATPAESSTVSDSEDEGETSQHGSPEPVYDSSSKQRVQSYTGASLLVRLSPSRYCMLNSLPQTDRILFHTSVVDDEPPTPAPEPAQSDVKPREGKFVGHFKDMVVGPRSQSRSQHDIATPARRSGPGASFFEMPSTQDSKDKLNEWKSNTKDYWNKVRTQDEHAPYNPLSDWFMRRRESSVGTAVAEACPQDERALKKHTTVSGASPPLVVVHANNPPKRVQTRDARPESSAAEAETTRPASHTSASAPAATGNSGGLGPSLKIPSLKLEIPAGGFHHPNHPASVASRPSALFSPVPAFATPGGDKDHPHRHHLLSSRSASTPVGTTPTPTTYKRFKSFFQMSSFFHPLTPSMDVYVEPPLPPPPPPKIVGPRKGQIQVLEYGAVTDLNKMGAFSDHRPVYLVAAIGLGGEPVAVSDLNGTVETN